MEHQPRYVGIDFHRRRSVIVHKDHAGELLETVHLDNDPVAFARELEKAGEHPEVVLEACYRAKLVALRSGLKSQVHSVLAKEGVAVPMTDLFGTAGQDLLDTAKLGRSYAIRIESLRELIVAFAEQVEMLEGEIEDWLSGDKGYLAIQAIPGVGPVLGAVFVAEIGDVARFSSPDKLCCWAGLTPRHRESDTHVHRGPITKQGSRILRWAAIEAASRHHGSQAERFEAISARRDSKKIARVALARHIVTLAYYGLRDGEIRCLADKAG